MSGNTKKFVITLDADQFGGRYENAAKVELMDKNSITAVKYVDLDELLENLIKAGDENGNYFRIGKLPQGYYDGQIYRKSREGITGRILVIAPKCKTRIRFERTEFMACCPTFLFSFSVIQGRLEETKVFALKGSNWNDHTYLYNCPLGNVSTYTHAVCWGSNLLPYIDSLHKLDVAVSLFYDSPCNNDHFKAGESIKWNCNNLREVLARLEKYEQFPEDELVASSCTIGGLLK